MWAGAGFSVVMCTGHSPDNETLGNKAGGVQSMVMYSWRVCSAIGQLVMLVVTVCIVVCAFVINPSLLDCLFLGAVLLHVVNMEARNDCMSIMVCWISC